MKTSTFISTFTLVSTSLAHMEMNWPYPLHSKFDPANTGANVDYNMIAPLNADGSNFPCKGYLSPPPTRTVASYQAGQTYNMSITGSAPHGGGSCQLSLSYDNGKTFKVIKSMIGGCPLTTQYDFKIPSDAPSGNAVFAWTWFNLIGNREMYMNCAFVNVARSTTNQTSIDQLPNIYVANIGGTASKTVENVQVVFPDPGRDVQYGGSVTGGAQPSNASISTNPSAPTMTLRKDLLLNGSYPTTLATALKPIAVPTNKTQAAQPSTNLSSIYNVPRMSAMPSATISSLVPASSAARSALSSSPTLTNTPCKAGQPRCDNETNWSVCNGQGSGYISMGTVAPGTICVDGEFKAAPSYGNCTGNPQIQCASNEKTFMVCDQGDWVDMGPVAAGTKCLEGSIVAA